MARGGLATAAIVGIVVVVLVGAGVFGYMFLAPSSHNSSTTTQSTSTTTSATITTTSTTEGNVVISNAAVSNSSLLVTIQNTGAQPVSISSLLVTPGSGCSSTSFFGSTTASSTSASTSSASQTNQTRTGFALPACMEGAVVFTVQSNSTLKPIALGQFNFTHAFNSTKFSRTFSRNASRTFSANSSRTISGNFTRGGFPGFAGNVTGGGVQLAAGQSVTLTYVGQMGSGVTEGSQYTIMVTGQGADAQITLKAT